MKGTFDPERWAEIRSTFDDLVELDDVSRREKLKSITESDPELATAVMHLLKADKAADEQLANVERAFSADDVGVDPLRLVGRTVSHFRIIEPIAGGGMGIVYKAEDVNLGRVAALKFPLPERQISRQLRQRFLHEARSVAKVDHANLCSIYETGETEDGDLFIAMPFYSGETLRARLEREQRLEIPHAIRIAIQTAQGLSAAHKAGIVHRDLKPANIMLLDGGSVKILDFGLAKVSDLALTTSSVRVGTAAYMAPEQVEGEPLDGRTDLWALGVVLYEMIVGQRPFGGNSEISIAHSILHKPAPPPSVARPEINAALESAMLRLLAKDPADRFQSGDELVEGLNLVLSGSGRAPTLAPRAVVARRKFSLRTITISAVATAFVLAGGAYLLWKQRTASVVDGPPQSIAVFPFAVSTDTTLAPYLATGIGNEVAALLTRVKHLRVVNKTDTPQPPRDDSAFIIAKKLGVSRFVTGELLREGGKPIFLARVVDIGTRKPSSVKVIRADLSDLPAVSGVLVQGVLDELRITPSKEERALVAQRATSNRAAYDLYLRGRNAETQSRQKGWEIAQSFYWRAREMDPGFAMARARLALTHAMLALSDADSSEARREQARIEAETALRIHPDLSEAYVALGYYWLARHDRSRATTSFQRAIALAPTNPDAHMTLAAVYRRNGRWEEAAAEFERVLDLQPDNESAAREAAYSYSRMRRYRDAIRMWDTSLVMNPRYSMGWVIRGAVYLRLQGQVDTLDAALQHISNDPAFDGARTHARVIVASIRRRYADALLALDGSHAAYGDNLFCRPIPLLRGIVYREMGDSIKARAQFAIAQKFLRDSIAADPRNPAVHIALGLAYAGLGKVKLAKAEAKMSTDLAPLARDAMAATAFAGDAAEIYTMVGDNDAALQLLKLLLAMPAGREVSVPLLRVDPIWDPLRTDPRFERLLIEYSD